MPVANLNLVAVYQVHSPSRAEDMPMRFKKLMVANRSEIAIRVFRTAHELGLRTVAVYSHEDRFALHRFKADEAYKVGKAGEPIRSYLDIEALVDLAVANGVDAIHPGYGFLSENARFAKAVRAAGIAFVGPRTDILEHLGDKVIARGIADKAGVPILAGSSEAIQSDADAFALAEKLGYPVIVKASMGGGGRGMRVATSADQLHDALDQARREAGTAFGVADVFLEKFIRKARHIEVQLIGDGHGGLVHLFERDCSVQRRHQKIVEIAPAVGLEPALREQILEAGLAIGRAVGLDNAGTVEFLVDAESQKFYFIEVNPRIQVEHTVTEEVTGFDIVKCQIMVASGSHLAHAEIGLGDQASIKTNGFAIQCRVTSENPAKQFLPDYGRITNYRSSGGMGIRLDAGSAYTGAVITPFYDSLLVKVTARALDFREATRRMLRSLQEFRVRGVQTNIPFLINLVGHPKLQQGECTTRFIDETPSLFELPIRQDRASRLLQYVAEIIVNGHPEVKNKPARRLAPADEPRLPQASHLSKPLPKGTRDRLLELGADQFSKWLRAEKRLHITDTTFRDAHQSLLATRLRTRDMVRIAPHYAMHHADLFSLEMWGGATFDTSMRFLKECPWERLATMRGAVPNILFQMLLRSASAVGYTNYPDNAVYAFVAEAADAGIDLLRVFDANNGLDNLTLAIEAVRRTKALCEASICYTGDITDPSRTKYTLSYYVGLAKELAKRGAHIIAIKDMAGLCKPLAARQLVRAIRSEVGLPVHFHTHDCSGGQLASLMFAADEDVDVVDVAMAPMAGMTSQVSLHALVESMRSHPRDTGLDRTHLLETADYWEKTRAMYGIFETGQLAPGSDIYENEMPGGQYTNLFHQGSSLGLASRWREVCQMYAAVNRLFGDIVKVTPTSKVVGDMALFMVGNNLSPADILENKRDLSFPESVVEFFEGRLGEPPGGFPEPLQSIILRGRKPLAGRAGALLPPIDWDKERMDCEKASGVPATKRDLLSYVMYPKVYPALAKYRIAYSDTSVLPTPVFFHGLLPGEEASIDIEKGKTLIVRFLTVGDPQPGGTRTVFFELNGQPREIVVVDESLAGKGTSRTKANPADPREVGAPMPGAISRILVGAGESIAPGHKLFTLEAMKMETTVLSQAAGKVVEVVLPAGTQVDSGDLVLRLA